METFVWSTFYMTTNEKLIDSIPIWFEGPDHWEIFVTPFIFPQIEIQKHGTEIKDPKKTFKTDIE